MPLETVYGTPVAVIAVTGVTAKELNLVADDDQTADEKLEALLGVWLEWISGEIHVRLARELDEDDDANEYVGVTGIAVRTCAKLIGYAIQMRAAPIVRVNDFAVQVLNTSKVTEDLDRELAPYIRTTQVIDVYMALPEEEEDED